MRVVSLVPSATETLLALGADVVACTRFCEQPDLTHVGGTKNPDVAAIIALGPDLVVLDEEENRREDAAELRAAGLDLVVTAVRSVADATAAVTELARATGRPAPSLPESTPAGTGGPTAFVPIWRRPWMSINADTYGASVLAALGVGLVTADEPDRYPVVDLDDVAERRPAVVLVPSEPYDFTATHVDELARRLAPAPVRRVDGRDLFWWGIRTPGALHRLGPRQRRADLVTSLDGRPVRETAVMPGPLDGYRIIEIAGIGPGPFAAMMLADMGADVIRVERADAVRGPAPATSHPDVLRRGRRNVAVDLKHADGLGTLLDLVERADALIEGFRPGVMERLGAGPDACLARNPKLVYGRMTGWGQDGPYALAAGHDINYIALAGALAHIGRAGEAPVPPLNLVGDFGGGGMFLAYGVVCALLEAQRSGRGQVVDAAMVDGAATLMTMFWAFSQSGAFDEANRGTNLLDTGAHFYDVYRCADGGYVSIGSIEPQFYAELLRRTGLDGDEEFAGQMDVSRWPRLKERLTEVFATKTRDEWCALMEATDVCFAPVLTMSEAAAHPHNVARATIVEVAGVRQPAPAPRLSRTPGEISRPPAHAGQHTREVLEDWGVPKDRIDVLVETGAVVTA